MSRSGEVRVADREQAAREATTTAPMRITDAPRQAIFDVDDISVFYGDKRAIRNVTLDLHAREITALIGPSGCGKSTFIRCLNRMNDLIPSARVEGRIGYHGENLYDDAIDPVQVRKRIGMVFQKPNPFPKSIYENIAFGPRVMGRKGDMDEIVERALRRGALWDEVKDRLKTNAFGMSGGQQQAARVSDMTAFFTVELDDDGKDRTGAVVEYAPTGKIFTNPDDKRTEDYVTGKVG